MRISMQAGVYSAFVGLFGAGAVVIWPDRTHIGYGLLTAAMAMLAWGLKFDGKHWWTRDRPTSWMPLHMVFRHLAFQSAWARKIKLDTDDNADAILQREFIEACARGDLQAYGRVQSVKSPYTLSAASEEIPTSFWVYAFVQPFAEIFQNDATRGAASTHGAKFYNVPQFQYREVSARTVDVMALWPKARWKPFNRRSVKFAEAFKAYIYERAREPDRELDDMISMLTSG